VQVEDLGEAHACFVVRLLEGGGILWLKQVEYRDILGQGLPKSDQDDAIRASMERPPHAVGAGLAQGNLP